MIRILYITTTIIVLTASCKSKPDDRHLPQQKMEKVLMDVQLAEVYSSHLRDTANRMMAKNMDSLAGYYKIIFAHHDITEAEFSQSLVWYRHHAELLDTVYTNMLPVASKWQSNMLPYKPATPPSPVPPTN
ncbi:MAG: DUF4296 domain-containing protein [Bacteroidota bacterium]